MGTRPQAGFGVAAICGMLAGHLAAACQPRALMTSMSLSRQFDRIAIALSAVCIVHCLAVPLFAALLPIAFVGFGADSHFHEVMLWGVVPTSLLGFGLGLRYHGRYGVALTGAIGLAVVAYAAVIAHASWPWWQEVALSVVGSALLVVAHWRNFIEVRRLHLHG